MDRAEEFITESVLGTKEYWDDVYTNEIENAEESVDDTWFGKRNANMIIQWIKQNIRPQDSICDIGCGNGWMLSKLLSFGFEHLCGVDYSAKAIEYCQLIYGEKSQSIKFQVLDILEPDPSFEQTFDVLLDKGTYDALCLTPGADIQQNRQRYLNFITKHLQANGYFIIMSCNFTKDELFKFILHSEPNLFECIHEFDTPSFQFGGQVGKQVTGLVFRKL